MCIRDRDWSRSYGVENEVWKGYSVEPVANDFDGVKDDGYVICGTRSTFFDATKDWLIIETDNQGTLISAETQGTWGEDDEALCVKQVDMDGDGVLDPGEYVVGGYVSYAIGLNPPREIAAFIPVSYTHLGAEKYIEVKTTKMGINTPIFFTRNELEFSKKHASKFRMYRLYDLATMPRMFIRKGAIDSMCNMVPISYKGYFLE